MRRARLGSALTALAIGLGSIAPVAPVSAQTNRAYKPAEQIQLSIGEGRVVRLPRAVADVWVSNDKVADVHVTNARQLNIFGKDRGAATIIATAADGSVVYATNIGVSQNLGSVNEVIQAAMPGSDINVTTIGQVAVINGTVGSPEDAAQAQAIVTSLLNPGKKMGDALDILPINRLKTATPLQVNLKVRIAEVNRTLMKSIGVNLLTQTTGGFQVGLMKGSGIWLPEPGSTEDDESDAGGIIRSAVGSTITGAGNLFGLDILSSFDLAEADGLVSTLAEPNLTALSGETASFLAGGEFPVPLSQELGVVTVEYKEYGVALAFTPTVLADGRISMRVRPEVSELSTEGAIRLNGYDVPALITRRAETTLELGSGQSFMLGGLLQNTASNSVDKAPVLGDLPILGSLFRSTRYRRQETELVIIVTPYLVRPVSHQLALPTNGFRQPTDAEINLEGRSYRGPARPRTADPATAPAPGIAAGASAAATPGFKL